MICLFFLAGSTGIPMVSRAMDRALAGSYIYNQAAATFTWNGISLQATSNRVATMVLGLYDFELKPEGTVNRPAQQALVAAGGTVYLPYILTNTGNIIDRYRLALPQLDGFSSFTPVNKFIYWDKNGDGILDPGEATPLAEDTPPVRPGEAIHLLVRIDVQNTARSGDLVFLDLQAWSRGDPSLPPDLDNVLQVTVTDRAVMRLSKRPSVSLVNPGGSVTYTMNAVNLGGTPAYPRKVSVDGSYREGILIQSVIPESDGGGTVYGADSLAGAAVGHLPVFSTDGGETWSQNEAADPAAISHVGYLIGGEILPGQSIILEFEVRVALDRGEGPLYSRGTLFYADQEGGPEMMEEAETLVRVVVPGDQLKVFIGPEDDPQAAVNGDANADFTIAPGLGPGDPDLDLPPNAEVAGNLVVFRNTVENASNRAGTVNLEVDTESSNLPADWTVLMISEDGVTPLADSNGDGRRDLGVMEPGERVTITVKIYIPPDTGPGDNAGEGYRNVIRASMAASPEVFNLTSNIVEYVIEAETVWQPLRKHQRVVSRPMPGDSVTYTLEFKNQSSETLTNVLLLDELTEKLVEVRNLTQWSIPDLDNPGRSVEISGSYETASPHHKVVWNLLEVPAGFRGQVSFQADFAKDLSPGTEISNHFYIRSDQTQFFSRSNTVSVTMAIPDVLAIEKTASQSVVEIGDLILYSLIISNSGNSSLQDVSISDILPRGFRYDRHSATIDGQPFEPAISEDGHGLTWRRQQLPAGASREITYACFVSADAIRGDGRNRAVLSGFFPVGFPASVSTFLDVEVRAGRFENRSVIFGKVFLDQNENRLQDYGEPGIGGVRLYLEDGTYVETDREGKFHFEGVRSGMRVLRLDQSTLDPELEAKIIDSSHAGNPLSRFVNLRFGTPHKANFRVVSRAQNEVKPLAEKTEEQSGLVLPLVEVLSLEAEPDEQTRPEMMKPQFMSPVDGAAFISRSRINVQVSCHLTADFDLFINDEPIDKSRIGETQYRVKERRVEYGYVGVALQPGSNQLRFKARSPVRDEVEVVEIMVHRSSAPAFIRVVTIPEKPTADGRTEPVLEISLLDQAGVPTASGSVLTVLVDRGGIVSPDLRPIETGHQVQVRDGLARIRLSAADQSETRQVRVLAGDLEYAACIRFSPDLRDWIVTGVAGGSVQRREQKDEARDDRRLRSTELEDRLAFFARGQLPFELLMTASFDSKKEYDDGRIFQSRDPLEDYPVYGDESEQKYDAESRDKLFVKLEREDSHLMWGDFKTGLDGSRLAAFDRSFTGAHSILRGGWFDLQGFFSRNDQAQVKIEIRGRGISGYYDLVDRNLIANSERVTIETRDRFHPERRLESESKRRYIDYDIDYKRGRILFKQPVASVDRNLNPLFIVLNYEVDGRKAEDYNVYGGRAAVHDPEKRFELGITHITAEAMPRDYRLAGFDFTVELFPTLTLNGEYGQTETIEGKQDQARLLELLSEHEKARFRTWFEDLGEDYENLSKRGVTAGLRTYGLEGEFQVTDKLRFRDQFYSRRSASANISSEIILHDNIYTMDGLDLLLGGGYASETEARPDEGDARRRSPILRTGAGLNLGGRWRIESLHQHGFGDTTFEQPTCTKANISCKLDNLTRAYLGGERRDRMAGGSEYNLALGIERQLNRYLSGFQETRLDGVADGWRIASGTGLDLGVPVTSELAFDATGEVSRTLDRRESEFGLGKEDFWSLALAAFYRPLSSLYTASARYEVRDSDISISHLFELGGTVALNPDHTMFGRNILTYSREREAGTRDSWSLDLRTGWAYRPVVNDRLLILSDIEVKTESATTTAAGRNRLHHYRFSGDLHYQPLARTWIETKYTVRLVRADFANTDLFSDVKAVGMQYELSDRFYGACGLRMLSIYEGPSHQLSYGLELGYHLRPDLRLAGGYNFSGFEDRDFARNDNWQKGFYLAVYWKFDESTLGILQRLEGR